MVTCRNNQKREISIANGKDRVIQQAFKMILQSAYEPIFLNYSHGFRPGRSPHSAIFEVRK